MKSAIRKLLGVFLAAGALLSPQIHADDIDLYTGGEATTGAQANVLIVLDNMADWARAAEGWPEGKQGLSELEALSEILSTLGDSINVGLLMGAGSNGGYVRFAVRELNATNKTAFTGMLNTMVANFGGDGDNDDKVNTASIVYDNMMNAAYRYFNGFPRFGTTDLPSNTSILDLRDYNGNNNSPTKQPAFPNNLGGYSLSSVTATTYSPPAAANGGCAKNFIIFIGNGYPNQTGSTTDLSDAAGLAGITNATTLAAITAAISGGSPRMADEWARFMYNYGVRSTVDDPRSTTTPKAKLTNRITTYTIDVCKNSCDGATAPTTDANRDQAILLKSMAKVGGGKYFKSTSKQEIKNAMALIFAEIQAVNSVFASASLPVSVNTQGTFENQIYVGVFRPDGGSRPRWFGNLKEYKIGRFCDIDRDGGVRVDSTRPLVNGMIPATLTGNATGPVTGTFSGRLINAANPPPGIEVSGNVSGTISGTARGTLAATFGSSAGTTGSPGDDLGTGTVTGTITGTGTGTGTSDFTGTLFATPSLTGGATATDWRIGEDVPVPNCGTDATGKIARLPYFADRNGNRATDDAGGTGFIDLQARSHWTAASTFWAAAPSATSGSSDLPDGPDVERGAAAQRLRGTWAGTATAPHQDGRKVYTCLGTCLTGAAAADKQLYNSANAVYTTNSAVTTALAAPTGSATVTLARTGNTVTATSTAAHGFSDGTATIAGATPTDYNGVKTITVTDATHFTYALNEVPSTTDIATATKPGGPVSVTSITLSGTTPGTTVTATVTAPGHGLNATNATTIAGAAQAFLNGVKTVTAVAGNTFTFSVPIPGGDPTTPLAGTATIKCGGTAPNETATATWDATTGRFTFNKSGTGNFGSYPNGCRNATAGATVTVTGAADSKYNGNWTVVSAGNATVTAGTLAASTVAVSPDAGAGTTTATTPGTSFPINITRTLGSTTATATTYANAADRTAGTPTANHAFTTIDTITITGAAQSQYNGSFSPLSVPTTDTFTFGPITLTPVTPPTGTITATTGSGTAGPDTTNLILWTRGKDLWEDEDVNGALTNVRASIHADVLHSRPAVVNYGSAIGIVGFYGANDGFLRAVHGGTASVDGEEKWAFIPSEFMNYNKLARLYKNSNLVRYPNLACTISPTPTARDYFWDGPITVYQSPDGTASTPPSKSWLFAIMRRGGRSMYALDVTDPDLPKFMWRISNTHFNNTPSTTYAELGQTWSEPQIAKLKGTFTRADATVITDPIALIFGAGYDAAQEDKPTGSHVTPTMGRGVFVVEAETGQLIQFLAPTTGVTGYSFAADTTVYDQNADGYADRIYAADTNANVFRFDTVQTETDVASSSYWKRYHIARVGDIDANGGANARKFLFKPEILPFTHSGVIKTMVLLGSGNREKPLNNFTSAGTVNTLPVCLAPNTPLYSDTYFTTSTSNKVNDRFFGLLDAVQSGAVEATVNGDPIQLGDLQQINSNTVTNNTLTPFSLSGDERGWQILLRNDPDGNGARNEEKTVNAAKVIGGIVFFATNTPVSPNVNGGICSNLGQALSYALDPITGMPAFNRDDSTSGGVATYTATDFATVFAGGGLPPTAVSGTVMVGGEPVNICIGCGGKGDDGTTVFTPTDPSPQLTGIRTRLYWSYGAD